MWGPARQTTVQSRAPVGRPRAAWGAWGACRGVVRGCGLLPSLSLRGCGEEDARELRPESLGVAAGALAAGLSPAGMAGVPWGPVGAEAPHVGRLRNHDLCFRHRSS